MSKADLKRTKADLVKELELLRARQAQNIDRGQQLIKAQTKFQSLLNNADDAIMVFTSEGLIESFNRSAEKIFGLSEISVLYRSAEKLFPCPREYDRDVPRFLMDYFEDCNNQEENPLYAKRSNGEEFPIEISIKEIRPEDLIMFGDEGVGDSSYDSEGVYVCIVRDVTARRRYRENLIRAKEDAEQASRAKSQFLANISHEIRTPMHGVLGMLTLGLHHRSTDPELKGILEIAHHAAENLLDLLNGMLEFSQIDSEGVTLQQVEFNLRFVVEDVAELLSEEAHQKNVDLITIISNTVPEVVYGDPTRFRQIIVNLMSNGVKFTNEGRVILRVSSLGMRDGLSIVRFEVSDTGIGIPEDKLEKIFDLFAQADESNTRVKGGSGIGLALTKQLVERMGGRIYVFSQIGHGSTFGFTVSVKPGEQPEIDTGDVSGAKVLVGNASSYDLEVIGQYFKDWSVEWQSAEGEKVIVDQLLYAVKEKKPYQILLLSNSASRNAREHITETIASFSELEALKLIALNTRCSRDTSEDLNGLQVHALLAKPIRKEVLYECISALLQGNEIYPVENIITSTSIEEVKLARNKKVLLVEDNKVNQLVAVGMMKKMGLQIDVANNGEEAVEAIKIKKYDLIFMDCHMPIKDGYEATKEIRAWEDPKERTPIIALTANCVHENEAYCLEVGMDAYMKKPFKSNDLKNIVNRWASSSSCGESGASI